MKELKYNEKIVNKCITYLEEKGFKVGQNLTLDDEYYIRVSW